jgi:hypothetical protein
MQSLKSLVIFLGILIITGIGLVIYALVGRSHGHGATREVSYNVDIAIPAGNKLQAVTSDSGHLLLHMGGGEQEQLLIIDAESGQLLGTISFHTANR